MAHLAAAWPWFSDRLTAQYFKLFSQVASVELAGGESLVRNGMAGEWIDLLASGFEASGYTHATARTLATITSAQLRGLFLDLDATADARRVADAFQFFVGLLQAYPAPEDCPRAARR